MFEGLPVVAEVRLWLIEFGREESGIHFSSRGPEMKFPLLFKTPQANAASGFLIR